MWCCNTLHYPVHSYTFQAMHYALKYIDSQVKSSFMKKIHLTLVCTLLFLLYSVHSSGQLLALKTDALMDVGMIPNFGVEVITGGKTSINATVFGSQRIYKWDVKMIGVMPEFRFWFNGRPMTREFIGVSAMVAYYDITGSKQKYKGDAYAGAITFGYSFVLGLHWSLECHGGIGLLYYDQQRYYIGDRIRDSFYNANGFHIVPYNFGVTFAYLIR